MSSITDFKKIALLFEGTDTKPHFERTAFRVKGKIFATLLEKDKTINLKLTLENQYVFSKTNPAIYPVAGGWGRMGMTTVELTRISKTLLKEMVTSAYCRVAPKKLAEKYI
jgi:hypothetical protein